MTAKKTVFDVSKPGAPLLKATPTSRPIIVSHDSNTDGTVTGKTEVKAPEAVTPRTKKIVIEPLHNDVMAEPEPVAVEAPKTPEPAAVEPSAETSEPVSGASAEPTAPVIDDQKERDERAAGIAKLIAEQTYVLPIETAEERRSKRAVIVGSLCIILLLLAWYNVALDARLLPNTFNLPHTGFFGVK